MAFIEAHGLSKSFGSPSRHVLDRVSLTVERGEFVSIVGFMGCGKSTLLNLLAGVTQPDTGAIDIDGKPLRGIARQASIVFQNYSLLPWFSAVENVRLAVDAAHPEWSRARAEGSVRAVSASGRSRQRDAPQAEPALRRNAAARRHRPRIRDRSRSAVSRRTVRRARRADARKPSAGARAALLGGRAPCHHGDDYEQHRRGAAALGPDRSDDEGTTRDARRICRRRSREAAQRRPARARRAGHSSPEPTSSSACPITCARPARGPIQRAQEPPPAFSSVAVEKAGV